MITENRDTSRGDTRGTPVHDEPLTLLLIEDTQEDVRCIKECLVPRGREDALRLLAADTFAAGLALLREHPVDLILMDLSLPDIDALDAYQSAKAADAGVPVIVLATQATAAIALEVLCEGADEYLYKHELNDRVLLRSIRQAIERSIRELDLVRRAALFRALVENADETVFILDERGIIQYVSPSVQDMMGYEPDALIGRPAFDFLDPKEAGRIQRQFRKMLQRPWHARHRQRRYGTGEVRLRHRDGSWRLVESSSRNMLQDPKVGGFIVNARDVTRSREKFFGAVDEKPFRMAARNATDAIISLEKDDKIMFWNKAAEVMFGFTWREALGRQGQFIVSQSYQKALSTLIDRGQSTGTGKAVEMEGLRKNGTTFPVELTVTSSHSGRESICTMILRDITERKKYEKRLLHDAFHDRLTGLPNRVHFIDRLRQSVASSKHVDCLFAVLFLDVDRFKVINDSLLHEIGDSLLVAFAERLRRCLGDADLLARFGGDEFTILLEGLQSPIDAARAANAILKSLSDPFILDDQEVFTSASIGIALSSIGYDKAEDLLRDAEIAMHRAKSQGKARYLAFDEEMRKAAVAVLELETDMRHALRRNEFELYYQPVVSLASGRIAGFEALIRWHHPVRGLLMPDQFIPLAEEMGLIHPIGIWVLEEACTQMKQWNQRFPEKRDLTMSVNLSGRLFARPDLLIQLDNILKNTGLGSQRLRFEITESVFVDNVESTAATLMQLKALNIQLYIDDFGTGYSSLSYLQHFPVDTLKIDRSFVQQMDANRDNAAIVKTVISLARNLGMNVVAEGVEKALQLDQLRQLGCDYAQGFLFSRPVDRTSAEALIAGDPRW